MDIRRHGLANKVLGVDQNVSHGTIALQSGLVDELVDLKTAISKSRLVILATPVNTLPVLVNQCLDHSTEATVLIDTGSTKQQVCKAVTAHRYRDRFVAAHPIAGTENSGPEAAIYNLFNGKTNIICERDKSSSHAISRAMEFFGVLGMNSIFMDPVEHDRHAAYVSHLSHVSSFLLGHTVLDIEKDEKNIFALAGSGFASTVRLAKSSPEMWAPIFEQNAEFLSQALLEYIMHLQRFQYHLMKKDAAELTRIMSEANAIRRVLEGLELKQSSSQNVEELVKNNNTKNQ